MPSEEQRSSWPALFSVHSHSPGQEAEPLAAPASAMEGGGRGVEKGGFFSPWMDVLGRNGEGSQLWGLLNQGIRALNTGNGGLGISDMKKGGIKQVVESKR